MMLDRFLQLSPHVKVALAGDHLTLPFVIPILTELRKSLSAAATQSRFGKISLAAFVKYFNKYFSSANLALCAAALHPLYGKLDGIPPAVRDETWAMLASIISLSFLL